ncbi:MAG: 50S ribosomal protein L35 [Parachlamydiales bacterium]|nr:50S ribosomal protein L35 [Parachlamydiales bacterium]
MTKLKTNKSVQGRFKVTKNKKLKASKCNRRHILTKKSSNRKRRLGKKLVVDESKTKTYLRMMGLV